MKSQNARMSSPSAGAWFAVGAAGALLGACSQSPIAESGATPAANPTLAATNLTAPTTTNATGTVAIDPAAMELNYFGARSGRDPIIGNGDGLPSTFAPAGTRNDGMALDVMESLAQVTFAKQGSDFDPSLSRDGKTLVFASTQHRPTSDIYIKSVNGRTVTQLTADPAQDVMPTLSPDGERVAFASNRSGSWDVYVMSVTGGQSVQVTSDPAQELHPSWSPDGTKLVYSRLGQVSGRWEMWVVDIDQPMASEFIGYGLFPSWCPATGTGQDGRDKIVFQRSRERGDRAFSVWTVDYQQGDASSPTEIASNPSAACINPTWSPDGQWIVYASVPFAGVQGIGVQARPSLADLWMCGVDGSGRVNLTTGRSVNLTPTWGADSRIYFVSDRGGIENVWSIGTEKAMLAATGGKGSGGVQTARNTGGKTTGKATGAKKPALTTVTEGQGGTPSH